MRSHAGMRQDTRAPGNAADGDAVVERILALMRERGGRATSARRLLLQALLAQPGHCSAEELAADIHPRAPGMHITTIYRNLEELERLGVIDSTRLGSGPVTYHLPSTAHGHLACEICGSLTEVSGDMFGDLIKAARSKYGFTVNPQHFAVTGHCAACEGSCKPWQL